MAEESMPPVEKSLKYMAWNIKEMSAEMKKISGILEQFLNRTPQNTQKGTENDEIPF